MIFKKLFIILIFLLYMGLIVGKVKADTGNCTPPFSDIPCDFWAINEIIWAKERGITKGYSDGTYRPFEPIKRDAMAAFIVRALFGDNPVCEGGVSCEDTEPYFRDVDRSQPFFRHIQKLYEAGITKGWPDGTYRPYENIRRDAMAAFLIRALGYGDNPVCEGGVPCENTEPYFMDVGPTHPFYKHIQKLKETGITKGCRQDPPMFCPDSYVTRDAMAVFLYRAFFGTYNIGVGAISLSAGPFGALMVSKSGEVLLPIVERDTSGNPVKITGALYINGEFGTSVLVYVDDNGKPTKAFIGDFIFLFSNWSKDGKTVDIAMIYTPTNYIEIFRGVNVNTSLSVTLSPSAVTKVICDKSSKYPQAICFPNCDTPAKNWEEGFKIAGTAISYIGCLTASPILVAISCPAMAISVASLALYAMDEKWYGIEALKAIFTDLDIVRCVLKKDVLSCVQFIASLGEKFFEFYNILEEKNREPIETASSFLFGSYAWQGIVQAGGGLPKVPQGKYYECTPGGASHYMPCLLGGVRECQDDYTYGPCLCDNGTRLCEPCGDGNCNRFQGENSINCPSDCKTVCGNGICESGEDSSNCRRDCETFIGDFSGSTTTTVDYGHGEGFQLKHDISASVILNISECYSLLSNCVGYMKIEGVYTLSVTYCKYLVESCDPSGDCYYYYEDCSSSLLSMLSDLCTDYVGGSCKIPYSVEIPVSGTPLKIEGYEEDAGCSISFSGWKGFFDILGTLTLNCSPEYFLLGAGFDRPITKQIRLH